MKKSTCTIKALKTFLFASIMGLGLQAQGSIIYTDVADVTMTVSGTSSSLHINPLTGQAGLSTFAGEKILGWFGYSSAEYPLLYAQSFVRSTANTGLAMLGSGIEIGASSLFGNTDGMYFELHGGAWGGGGLGYTGFRLSSGSDFNYGYLHFNYDDAANTVTLLDMAIESTVNTSILSGNGAAEASVPEPGTIAILSLGIGALGLTRRRRKISK